MSEQEVTLPWIDEPMELSEAIEALGEASVDDGEQLEEIEERIEQLERRVSSLEDGSTLTCPECESSDSVYKSGVGAAKLANDGSLNDTSADALNQDSHLCLDCRTSFTPTFD